MPFRALRYDPDVAGPAAETSAPPYDALDPMRYAAHRVTNPYTVLELIAGEGTGGSDDPGDGAFGSARATLQRWQRTGVLVQDPSPSLYLYEEHELRHGVPTVQRGIVGTLDLADLDDGHLLLHEHVDEERAALRARRMRAVPIDLTPVVAVHVGGAGEALQDAVELARAGGPVVAFTDEASIDHRIWRIADPGAVRAVADALAGTTGVLADGHHRIAAARRLRDDRIAAGLDPGPWSRVTTWVVDAATGGPELRAVHRLLPGLADQDGAGAPVIPGFHAIAWHHGAAALESALQGMPTLAVGLVTAAGAWVLRPDDEAEVRVAAADAPALRALDAQVVAAAIAPSVAAGSRAEAVFDVEQALGRLRTGGRQTLLLLRAPTARQVLAVAEAGLRMPAKTTWFRPKPRAGLLMRRLDDEVG
jgi:uncharacterized protein (DUF1015 family)